MGARFHSAPLLLALALLIPTDGRSGPVDECGRITTWGSCVFFASIANGYTWYYLDNYGSFQPGDLVHIWGESPPDDSTCGDLRLLVVRNNGIEACPPEDLGCGVLTGPTYDDECFFWISPIHGYLLCDERGYAAGDTLHAWGNPDRSCASFCLKKDDVGCLLQQRFAACSDTLTPVVPTTWGHIKGIFR